MQLHHLRFNWQVRNSSGDAESYNQIVTVLFFQTLVKTFEVCDLPVRASKFVARKNWVITGAVSHIQLFLLGSQFCHLSSITPTALQTNSIKRVQY